MNADTKNKVTIAAIVGALASAAAFVWGLWRGDQGIGNFVKDNPVIAVLVAAVVVAAAVYGIVRSALHRRDLGGRVRRARD